MARLLIQGCQTSHDYTHIARQNDKFIFRIFFLPKPKKCDKWHGTARHGTARHGIMGGILLIFSMKRFLFSLKEGFIAFLKSRLLQLAILWFLILLLISALMGKPWTTALFSWLPSLVAYWVGHILSHILKE